jgi:hypothetical protein
MHESGSQVGHGRRASAGDRISAAGDAKERNVLAQIASLKLLATPVLKARWRELFGTEPPAYNRRFLESRLAYRIQELAYGGLKPETIERLEALGEQLDGGNPIVRRTRTDMKPIAGTRLIREWKGVEHCVTVLDDGYEYQGRPFKSLSAIARTITGTRWNGLLFFGLARRNGTNTRKNNNKLCSTDRKPAVKGAASL